MSFGVALSGIQAASGELGVVGNNIANASTGGFKSSRAEFADVYAASGASNLAIGNGVRLANVSQSFNQGTISFTGKNLDLAVNGDGFFRLSDNGSSSYTRSGAFNIDREGYIVNSSGQKLTGYLADVNGNITGAQGEIQLDGNDIAPTATTTVDVGVNLRSTDSAPASAWVGSPNFGDPEPAPDTYNNATSTTVYDSLGNAHIMTLYFAKTANTNEWDVHAQIDGVDVDSNPAGAPFTQQFTSSGAFNAGGSDAISLSWSPLDGAGNANGAVTPQVIDLDLSTSTQFGSPFAVLDLNQDGATTGRLDNFDVDPSGTIFARYTNGQSKGMGQITLTNFQNKNGLQPLGDTAWGETFSSGAALTGSPGTSSFGLVQSGSLEDSNVDLTAELVKMIVAQRNLQANAKTIQTMDSVQQTIINIR